MKHSSIRSFLTLACVGAVTSLLGIANFAYAVGTDSAVDETVTTTAPSKREFFKNRGLTQEEVAHLKAARIAAQKDPAVREAMRQHRMDSRQFHQLIRDTMIKEDPSVAPILEKLGNKGRQFGEAWKQQFSKLTPEEQSKMRNAHQMAMKDPSVVTAREQFQQANSPEQRREAAKNMGASVKKAMIKADPSVAPLIEKMRPRGLKQ